MARLEQHHELSRVADLAEDFLEATHGADRGEMFLEMAFEQVHAVLEKVRRDTINEEPLVPLEPLSQLPRALAIVGTEILAFSTADPELRKVQCDVYRVVEYIREETIKYIVEQIPLGFDSRENSLLP